MAIDWERTSRALEGFSANQENRLHDRSTKRVLLKISQNKKTGEVFLEIKKDSFCTRLAALTFWRSDYKLKNIINFLQKSGFEALEPKKKEIFFTATPYLTQKITKHNARKFAFTKITLPQFATAMVGHYQDAMLKKQLESFIGFIATPPTSKDEVELRKKRLSEFKKAETNADLRPRYDFAKRLVEEQERNLTAKPQEVQKPPPPPPSEETEIRQIVKQDGDGNCLLRSFAVGVSALNHPRAQELLKKGQKPEQAYPVFRKLACEWLESYADKRKESPDEQLERLFQVAIVEHNRVLNEKFVQFQRTYEAICKIDGVSDEEKNQALKEVENCKAQEISEKPFDQAIAKYIELSKKDRFFCDMPHLYALSRSFTVSVGLYQESTQPDATGKYITLDPFSAPDGAKDRVILHFDHAGSHYNAVLPLKKPTAQVQKKGKVMPKKQVALQLGGSMANPGINSCYINSTLQALRFCPSFRDRVSENHDIIRSFDEYPQIIAYTELLQTLYEKSARLTPAERNILMKDPGFASALLEDSEKFMENYQDLLAHLSLLQPAEKEQFLTYVGIYMLDEIHQSIEKNQKIDANTIQAFRGVIFSLGGFGENDTTMTSQEDARSLLERIFELVRMPQTEYIGHIEHGVAIPVPSLTTRSYLETCVPVRLGVAVDNNEFRDLVESSVIMEELDRAAILHQERTLTSSERQEAEKLPPISQTPTEQRILLDDKRPKPKMLAFYLTRYTAAGTKVSTKIKPSETIDLEIRNTGKYAQYRLVAATVHSGATVRGGHYYTYVQRKQGDNTLWVELNDNRVSKVSKQKAEDDIAKQGYLFYYEYVQDIVKTTPGGP